MTTVGSGTLALLVTATVAAAPVGVAHANPEAEFFGIYDTVIDAPLGTVSETERSTAESGGGTVVRLATTTAELTAQLGLRPPPPENGGGPTCGVRAQQPRGHYDPANHVLYAHVDAYVVCNFVSREISFNVLFDARNGSEHTITHGPTSTCANNDNCSATTPYSRTLRRGETFEYEHLGTPYGTYVKPDGSRARLIGDGVPGPCNCGYAYYA